MTKVTKKVTTTQYYELESASGRIGLATCLKCGACIIINESEVGSIELHNKFHSLPLQPKKKMK